MGRRKGSKQTIESKKKISESLKRIYADGTRKPARGMAGKAHSATTRQKMSRSAKVRVKEMPHTVVDWTGKRHSIESRKKMSKAHQEGKGSVIKRGYTNLHVFIKRKYGKAVKCQECGSVSRIEWANKTGKYLRDISDWLQLCKSCHRRYDIKNKLFNKWIDEY